MRRRKLRWLTVSTSIVLAVVALLGGHSRRLIAVAEIAANFADADGEEPEESPARARTINPTFCAQQQKKLAAPVGLLLSGFSDGGRDRHSLVVQRPTHTAHEGLSHWASLQRLSVRWQV